MCVSNKVTKDLNGEISLPFFYSQVIQNINYSINALLKKSSSFASTEEGGTVYCSTIIICPAEVDYIQSSGQMNTCIRETLYELKRK